MVVLTTFCYCYHRLRELLDFGLSRSRPVCFGVIINDDDDDDDNDDNDDDE